MRVFIYVITLLVIVICVFSIYELKTNAFDPPRKVSGRYGQSVKKLESKISGLCTALSEHQSDEAIAKAFRESRLAYKRVEVIAAYFQPYTVQLINGPGVDSEQQSFQQLEKLLFPSLQASDTAKARIEAYRLAAAVRSLSAAGSLLHPTDAQLFDAMRLELVRIMSLSLSGFDSPQALYSLEESAAALEGVSIIWRQYESKVALYNPGLVRYTAELMKEAEEKLAGGNLNTFDIQDFTREYISRLSVNLKLAREALNIPYDKQHYILDPAASDIFAKNAVHPLYYVQDSLQETTVHDPVYNINGQSFRASYIYNLLKQNGAFNSLAQIP